MSSARVPEDLRATLSVFEEEGAPTTTAAVAEATDLDRPSAVERLN